MLKLFRINKKDGLPFRSLSFFYRWLYGKAAVDADALTRNEARFFRGEEGGKRGNLLGSAETSQRSLVA